MRHALSAHSQHACSVCVRRPIRSIVGWAAFTFSSCSAIVRGATTSAVKTSTATTGRSTRRQSRPSLSLGSSEGRCCLPSLPVRVPLLSASQTDGTDQWTEGHTGLTCHRTVTQRKAARPSIGWLAPRRTALTCRKLLRGPMGFLALKSSGVRPIFFHVRTEPTVTAM